MNCVNYLDLLKLSGDNAMEAIHDMVENGRHVKFGNLALYKIVKVGVDQESNRVVVGAELETGQSIMFSFDPHDEPTIEPHFQIIGAMQTIEADV